jgi:hypothetical protein
MPSSGGGHVNDHRFFVERDVVYTVQLRLWNRIRGRGLD